MTEEIVTTVLHEEERGTSARGDPPRPLSFPWPLHKLETDVSPGGLRPLNPEVGALWPLGDLAPRRPSCFPLPAPMLQLHPRATSLARTSFLSVEGGGGTAPGTPSQSRTCGGHSLIFCWPEPAQRPSGPGHRQGVCACTGQERTKSPTPSRGHFSTASQRGQLRAQGHPRAGGREGQGPREQSWRVLATHATPQRHSHQGGHPWVWLHWGGAEPGSPYSKKVPGTDGWVVGRCIGASGWSSVSARFTEI